MCTHADLCIYIKANVLKVSKCRAQFLVFMHCHILVFMLKHKMAVHKHKNPAAHFVFIVPYSD